MTAASSPGNVTALSGPPAPRTITRLRDGALGAPAVKLVVSISRVIAFKVPLKCSPDRARFHSARCIHRRSRL